MSQHEIDPHGTDQRVRRSDGEQTHATILDAAMRLASIDGLGGLTIGRLADEVGVSKSGLYAHFGSKHRLQLEVIDAARVVFEHEVIQPAMEAPPGLAQLRALAGCYLDYVDRRVFPGGCFFAGMLAEFDGTTGQVHDEVAADQREWLELVEGMIEDARANGELTTATDPTRLAFEITAATQLANCHSVLFDDRQVIELARSSIADAIDRARPREDAD